MSHDTRYQIILYWSEEEQAVIAEVPELPGPPTPGPAHVRVAGVLGPESILLPSRTLALEPTASSVR